MGMHMYVRMYAKLVHVLCTRLRKGNRCHLKCVDLPYGGMK